MIHFRDPNTLRFEYKTLCGYFIALMHVDEKYSVLKEQVTCEICKQKLNEVEK